MAEIVSVEGLADAKAALEALTRDMRIKVVRAALRDAARPIVAQARANAPVLTGLVKRRIGVSASRINRGQGGVIGVYIRPRATTLARRTRNRAQDPWYYRFQEAGFHAVGSKRIAGGRQRSAENLKTSGARFIPGKAFLGEAFQTKQRDALAIFQAAIKKRIDQANQRK
jgi:HK97 gp10 family phage protein